MREKFHILDLNLFIQRLVWLYCDTLGCFKRQRKAHGVVNHVHVSPWVRWMLPAWGELQVLWKQMHAAELSWMHVSFTALWHWLWKCPRVLSMPSMLWGTYCEGICWTLRKEVRGAFRILASIT